MIKKYTFICRSCKKELEIREHAARYICKQCGRIHHSAPLRCAECGKAFSVKWRVLPLDGVIALSNEPCDTCLDRIKELKQTLLDGGAFFDCKCGASGVIKRCSETDRIREERGLQVTEFLLLKIPTCKFCKKGGSTNEAD